MRSAFTHMIFPKLKTRAHDPIPTWVTGFGSNIFATLSPIGLRAVLLRLRRAHRGKRFFQCVDLRLHGGELRA
jgi:hypothetical protein